MEPLTAGMIAKQIAVKGFETLFSELVKKALAKKEKASGEELPAARFRDHLQKTFDRCTNVKTLLSRDEPVDMLQQYVNIKLRSRKRAQELVLDDYDVINEIRSRKKAVILGTAGGGKTVFMRYLWVSYFVQAEPRIPIFLELRRVNDITSIDLLTFIFRTIIATDEKSGMSNFTKAVAEGRFIFVFDGFDEVAADKKGIVEKQILDLSFKYGSNLVVVSSRPDDRFDAWQEFTSYRVEPLTMEQVKTLVERVDFDQVVKKKFTDALTKGGMYAKHQSFLSSPLLATMMLLTFQHYAEIPDKIHVFYDLAYQTLFSKHDALKEAFKREKYTKFPIDVFKKRLASLCVLTYIDEKFEFSHSDLLEYISKSAKLDGAEFDAEAFLKDLLESVCIMQQDGLAISFTHRSFQEFFTAVYLSNMALDKLKALLPRLASRESDSVFTMLIDMNRDALEEAYVVPMIRKARATVRKLPRNPTAAEILTAYGLRLTLVIWRRNDFDFVIDPSEDEVMHFRNLSRLMYRSYFEELHRRMPELRELDRKAWSLCPPTLSKLVKKDTHFDMSLDPSDASLDQNAVQTAYEWFEMTGHAGWVRGYEAAFQRMMQEVPRNSRNRSRDLKKILAI
jgi:hypothetical protein